MTESLTDDVLLQRIRRKIEDGQCVLFLGAGANRSSQNSAGQPAPLESDLVRLIAGKFYPDEDAPKTLVEIASCVEVTHSRPELNHFIHDILSDYRPAADLRMLAKLRWEAIYTTNYDLLVEAAFVLEKETALQDLTPIYSPRDPVVPFGEKKLPYFKLHGCISRLGQGQRLILTDKDYAVVESEQKDLYARLRQHLQFSTFLFIGYSLQDNDFTRLFHGLQSELGFDDFPRCYAVMPDCQPLLTKVWDARKIDILNLSAESFLSRLASISISKTPVKSKNFSEYEAEQAQYAGRVDISTAADLAGAFEFLTKNLGRGKVNHENFYKGTPPDWDIIRANCDAPRDLYELVMDEFLLPDETDRPNIAQFGLITAEAGAGKSTLLLRLAYDMAVSFEFTCLFYRPGRFIHINALEEFYRQTKKRIFIFIDNAANNIDKIYLLLNRANALKIPITILAAERKNEWNVVEHHLSHFIPSMFELKKLSDTEINAIIAKLDEKNYLRELKKLSSEERVAVFRDKERANKQLLVAMREATEGDNFDNIIQNEYEQIPSELGKKTYLWVCSLHLLGVPVRAGLLSRLAGVSFKDFEEKLYKPCEGVLLVAYDEDAQDYLYTSRHPVIAEITFRYAQRKGDNPAEIYLSVLNKMDLGYTVDNLAFQQLIRRDEILDQMPTIDQRRQFFTLALFKSGGQAFVYQHYGRMEMRAGNLDDAEQLLQKACSIDPTNPVYKHSIATLLCKRYQRASTEPQKERVFMQAREILEALIHALPGDDHSYTSLARLLITRAKTSNQDIVKSLDLAEAHQLIMDGLLRCRNKTFLRQVESIILKEMGDHELAAKALFQAHSDDPSNIRAALLCSKMLEQQGKTNEALQIILNTLRHNELHRSLNFQAGRLGLMVESLSLDKAKQYFRRSFDPLYADVVANVYLGAVLFHLGEYAESDKIFDGFRFRRAQIPPEERYYTVAINNLFYQGKIKKFTAIGRGVIEPDEIGRDVFFFQADFSQTTSKASLNDRLMFKIQFTSFGPIARELKII